MLKHWLKRHQSPAWTFVFAVIAAALIAATVLFFLLLAHYGLVTTRRA